MQRLLDQRDHRRDAAAAGEQDRRSVAAAQDEAPVGRRDIDDVARLRNVVEPVGDDAVPDPLDRDLQIGVAAGCARQRIAALDPPVVQGNTKRQKLPRLVTEQMRMLAVRPEPDRPCLRSLVYDLAYRERIEIRHRIKASGAPPAPTPEAGRQPAFAG